ncbi:ecdysone-induced protein 75B isoform X2 [Cimex lectularius]|uniref:RRM domain-containing protein n=1 Tax=Cimex lectularius TaxID=79782 RepID=A0A8I6TGG5_CIMLE|nr:ecdysone-induced protein 75B isoform X2 [Cimex lectularius]
MALQMKNKGMPNEIKDIKEPVESPSPTVNCNNNAPKYGTVIPNRIFVGGISSSTTEQDLMQLFSSYGTVQNAKIIVDRAGVSKGYGFVTFETDDEAKRLQKDAENIVLKERRLNIAPAIRKQVQTGYGRPSYEGVQAGPGSPVPLPNQVCRQNGVTYTFLNGVAYFPHQAVPPQTAQPMTPLPANHVEHSPVYTAAGTYSGLPQSNSGQSYPFSYAPQGHIYYQTHYPYPMPFEGCYQVGESHSGVVTVQSGSDSAGVISYPQYYLTHQPSQPDVAYFQPQNSVQPLSISQEPVMYTPPRGYDSTTVFYSEQKMAEPSTPPPQQPPQQPPHPHILPQHPLPHQISQIVHPNMEDCQKKDKQSKLETPVVSLSKVYHERNEDHLHHARIKCQSPGRKVVQRHLNNNNPDVTNRNVGKKPHRSSPVVLNSGPSPRPFLVPSHNQSSSLQVPQFPFYSARQYLNPVPPAPSYYPAPPRRTYYHRNKYSTRSKNSNTKWFNKDNAESGTEEGSCVMPNPLTPPITPRSPQDVDITVPQADDIVQSMQALAI